MAMLDSLYDELEIFQGWTSKPKTGPPAKTEKPQALMKRKSINPGHIWVALKRNVIAPNILLQNALDYIQN